ncbi:unnamed protein product [Cochlearia groenlandica]
MIVMRLVLEVTSSGSQRCLWKFCFNRKFEQGLIQDYFKGRSGDDSGLRKGFKRQLMIQGLVHMSES